MTIENMSLQCFYNRIYGTQKFQDENYTFWYHFTQECENYNIKVTSKS